MGSTLLVANVGDSRAILARKSNGEGWRALPLSSDHSFERDDERNRITSTSQGKLFKYCYYYRF